jgi:hypothetical protein
MVAGSQPIIVICKIKQMIPAICQPIVKKVSQGSSRAIRRRVGKILSSVGQWRHIHKLDFHALIFTPTFWR